MYNNISSITQFITFICVALAFGLFVMGLSIAIQKIFSIGQERVIKSKEYECGVEQFGKTRIKFDLKYYVFALMFLIFDVEFVFLLPYALHIGSTQDKGEALIIFLDVLFFIFTLVAAWYFALKNKFFKWD